VSITVLYGLIATGIIVMVVGELSLTRYGQRGWIHLSERQKEIAGADPEVTDWFLVGLRSWLPIFGLIAGSLLHKSTSDAVGQFGLNDLVVALAYASAFVILILGPNAVVLRLGKAWLNRHVARATIEDALLSDEGRGEDHELAWRSVVIVGSVMVGIGLIRLWGLPWLVGVPAGLIVLKPFFYERKRHLKRCRTAERAEELMRLDRDEGSEAPDGWSVTGH
jgi:hypothetical protein